MCHMKYFTPGENCVIILALTAKPYVLPKEARMNECKRKQVIIVAFVTNT